MQLSMGPMGSLKVVVKSELTAICFVRCYHTVVHKFTKVIVLKVFDKFHGSYCVS